MISETEKNANENTTRTSPTIRNISQIVPKTNESNNSLLLMLLILMLAGRRPFCWWNDNF